MAFNKNEFGLVAQSIGGAHRIWMNRSAEAATAIDANDYITDGADLGLRVSDSVIHEDTNTPLTTFHRVESVTAGAGGEADLAVGTTVGSATTGD